MSNCNRLLLTLTLLIVFFLFDSTKLNVRIEEKPRQKFLDQYVKTEWDRYLWVACVQTQKLWNPEHAYLIFHAAANAESEYNDAAKEKSKKNPKITISRGRFQIGKATYRDYCKAKKIIKKRKYEKDAHNKYINTDTFMWTMRIYYRIWGNFKQSLSSHNVGLTGFEKWKKRRNRSYYHYYISEVRRRTPLIGKNIL